MASWVMQGAVDALMSNSDTAIALRQTFVFKLVPMLNPDGVRLGNYRCSKEGLDLNRQWQSPHPHLTAAVYALKAAIKQWQSDGSIVLFCDIHGHSRNTDVFIYGNRKGSSPGSEVVLPIMCAKALGVAFSLPKSDFRMQASKAGTARMVVGSLGIEACTLEVSLGGCCSSTGFGVDHFDINSLCVLGSRLTEALLGWGRVMGFERGYTNSALELISSPVPM